jgi:hypothetical protein
LFVSKAKNLPLEWSFVRGLHSGRLLALPKNIRLGVEVNGIGKPSTKLQYGNNYSRKNLIVLARGERPKLGAVL